MHDGQRKVLYFDASRCTACHYCEVACSFSHIGDVDLAGSNVRIALDEATGGRSAVHCLHCDAALCMDACPSGAIYKDEERKVVLVNPLRCIGCGSCVAACPVGAPWLRAGEGVARKCDFCDGDPRCAKYCSPGALKVVTLDEWKRLTAAEDEKGGE